MFCPFMSFQFDGETAVECKREQCAVYDIDTDSCAFLAAVRKLDSLDKSGR